MKNLKNYDENCFDIYKEAVSNKYSSQNKITLVSIENKIESQFKIYDEKFLLKKLYEITPLAFSQIEKDSLIDLYQYKSDIIQKIKNKILGSQIRTINTTCQYCTLNSVKGLDHFIPKEDFPEFSVNPLNLFPCCPECNSKKNRFCFEGEISLFLNLYLDALPDKKYLIAEFEFGDDIPLVSFKLSNIEGIDTELFRTISNHYNRLDLLERMREVSNERITNIINSIKRSYKGNNNIESLKKFIIEEEYDNKMAYGFNHWESVLRLSLIDYDEFWKNFIINC